MKKILLSKKLIPVICVFIILLLIGSGMTLASTLSKQTTTTAIQEQTQKLMAVTEELRGLEFLADLPVELVSQAEIADIINAALDDELTAEMDYRFSELYAMLGLMPPNSSLRDAYQGMIEEQVAGLYDQHKKCFYVVDVDFSAMVADMFGDLGPLASFAEGLMQGMGYDMDAIMTETVIVHELTHALDDQHFDIEGVMDELMEGNSDDAQLAYQSLVEGNATRIMNEYTYGSMGIDSSSLEGITEMSMNLAESVMDYDPFLTRLMLVPYLKGEAFVNHLISQGGMDAVNDAFNDPPRSMEQILHPERYTPNRDVPSEATAPDLSYALPGWELETTDTLGELLIGIMFELQTGSKQDGERIADGWDFDVVTTWRSPDGDLALAMVTVWDSEGEAWEFFGSYQDLLELKYPTGSWAERESDYGLYTGSGLAAALEQNGRVVVIIEGVPSELADTCLYSAWPVDVTYR